MVYRFARLMTGSTSAAEDIVQEVFLVVMRDAGRYDPTRAALPSYLYGVARHQTRRRLARDRQFVALGPGDAESLSTLAEDDLTATLERREALQRLRRAILSLPRRVPRGHRPVRSAGRELQRRLCCDGMRHRHDPLAPPSCHGTC